MTGEIRFGTGGWRAEIGKEFTITNIQKVGQALAERILERGEEDLPVIIGYDRRFLSDTAAKWLAEVLAGNGICVETMHRSVPTPLVMHTVKTRKLHYGLEVTASHNPSCYNGIKVIVEEGRDAPLAVTGDLEERIGLEHEPKVLSFEKAVEAGTVQYLETPFNAFLDDILGVLDLPAIRKRGLRILFDSMHGSSAYPFNVVFYTARCTVDQINANKDAYFGGSMPAPTRLTLKPLSEQVLSGGYDIGMGIDGDGDRLGVIDSDGTYISANDILVLLYYYLHEYKGWKGPVVRNLATTHLLDRVAKGLGETCYEVPVGFKYISSKIDEVDAVLGGESSGGLTVRGHIHGKDSIYASALFVEMICVTGKTPGRMIRELREKYGESEMVEYNVPLSARQKKMLLELFAEGRAVLKAAEEATAPAILPKADSGRSLPVSLTGRFPEFSKMPTRVNFEDGCKFYFEDDSFVICRPSGTEPLLRVFAEAPGKEQAEGYIEAWKRFLAETE